MVHSWSTRLYILYIKLTIQKHLVPTTIFFILKCYEINSKSFLRFILRGKNTYNFQIITKGHMIPKGIIRGRNKEHIPVKPNPHFLHRMMETK